MKAALFTFVAALLTITCAAPGQTQNSAAPPAQPRRPNIVFVLVDDMRWDEMRVAGHPFIETPNMDRLAREGARFTNAFATTPLCSPSRASFLTGQYPHTNGIIDNTARQATTCRLSRWSCSAPATAPASSASGTWATTTARARASTTGWRCPGRAKPSTRRSTSMASGSRRRATRPTCSPTTSSGSSTVPRIAVPRLPGAQGDPSQRDSA